MKKTSKSLFYNLVFFSVFSILLAIVFMLGKKNGELATDNFRLNNRVSILVDENEMMYRYIENIDTFKTLENAIQASEDLYDDIQFLYE